MAALKLSRDERHGRAIWLAVPAFVFVILPIAATLGAAIAGDYVLFKWLSAMFLRNAWYIIPASVLTVPPLIWSLKIMIIDDIREDSEFRRADEILLKFAPDYYARTELPRWVQWAIGIVIALAIFACAFVAYGVAYLK